jgi:sugar (pentulose or hexulose) kinase
LPAKCRIARSCCRDLSFLLPSINLLHYKSLTNDHWSTELDHGWGIVVDIGKTLSKVTLWSRDGRLLDRQVRANAKIAHNDIARLDVEGIGAWLIDALTAYRSEPVEAIAPIAHGAGVAAIVDGALAFAPLDYENPLPPDVLADYRTTRDAFALTGSPALPGGLNLGAQLYWLDRLEPGAMRRAVLVPWAQYWAWFLSGSLASEVSSLGCHTDLWLPASARYSPLAQRRGWAGQFAPLARAGEVIGRLRPKLATATGLSPLTKVLAGLHDSNAALLAALGRPEIAGAEATVLSTGTWFIAMRHGAASFDLAGLPADRDCLANVDVDGHAVPSARFMGGREIELATEGCGRRVDDPADQANLLAAAGRAIRGGTMLLPTLAPGCGPFAEGEGRWVEPSPNPDERRAAACLYTALVADAALDLIGARDRLLIEGRFARAEVFVRALAALRPEMTVLAAEAQTDASFGALRLMAPELTPHDGLQAVAPLPHDLDGYRDRWRALVDTAGVGTSQCMHRSANS